MIVGLRFSQMLVENAAFHTITGGVQAVKYAKPRYFAPH